MERADSVFKVTIESQSQPQKKIYSRFALSLTALTFILVSFIVIFKRPDILGILFASNCILIAFLLTLRPVISHSFFHITGELIYDGLFSFLPAFFLHFFLIFPGKEIQQGTRRFIIRKILYIPPTIFFIALFLLALYHYSTGGGQNAAFLMNAIGSIYWALYMIASPVFFIRTYVTSDKIQRIKFRIATIGLVIGVVPVSVVLIVKQFVSTYNIPYDYVSMVFLSFISISFAYAILKHNAFDTRIVFRTGISFVIMPVILAILLYFLNRWIENEFPELHALRYYLLALVAVLLLFLVFIPAMNGIQKLLDRAFYKNRKLFQDSVIEFSRRLQSLRSIEEINDLTAREMHDLFGAEHVHLFLQEGGHDYSLKKSIPTDSRMPLTSFPPGTKLIRLVKDQKLPVMIEYYDKLWINNNLDRISHELLSISKVSAIVPFIDQDELLGFILLGRKRSGKPYSGSDVDVLELISERSAAAIRNNLLYRVAIEKEKLEKEIHLASKIQERLLPVSPPPLEHSQILGNIRTSREVGGDLYDFIEFEPGFIGMAVADVSGKGIPASILMTTLQASFRSEATADNPPGKVLAALNKCLYQRSELSKFATFFYATYDDRKGILHYSNAGSFPPLVIRADGSIIRLHQGGMLIGVELDTKFKEGIIKLKPGELVAIYTDGCIDQVNEQGEYFDETRLLNILQENIELPLEKLMEKLYSTILAFGKGNIKDDMTVILLKRNPQ